MSWGPRVTRRLGLVTLLLVVVASGVVACRGSEGSRQTIEIRYSRFSQDSITVKAGVPVTFSLRNDDPILHEWIVGPADVHERHRTGTERVHDEVPTEVTLPAYTSTTTTVTFDEPGDYAFICHLPGHEAYGMTGTVRVQ